MLNSSQYERPLFIWESNHVEDCLKRDLFKNKDVLEVGGVLPKTLVINDLGVKSWCSIDIAPYYTNFKENNYQIISGDICKADLEENFFDTVISTNSFEHILDVKKALQNIYRFLKPGGYVSILISPIWSCHYGHHFWVYDDDNNMITFTDNVIPPWSHLLYSEEELTDLLIKKYPPKLVKKITDQIYHLDCANRLFYEDYIEIFNSLPFEVIELRDWHKPVIPDPETQKILEEKYNRKNFATVSIKLLFRKT